VAGAAHSHASRGEGNQNALRPGGRLRAHAGRSGPVVRGHPRTHPPNRGQSAAQAAPSFALAQAAGIYGRGTRLAVASSQLSVVSERGAVSAPFYCAAVEGVSSALRDETRLVRNFLGLRSGSGVTHPILARKVFDLRELLFIVGDHGATKSHGLRGDKQVIGADQPASLFKSGAQKPVLGIGGCL